MIYKTVDERYKPFIENIISYFNQDNNTVIYDKRNVIKIVEYEKEKYVVKSFKTPHLLNRIVYRFFRESKAKRSYDNSIKLASLNINTPQPIAYIEMPTLMQFKESFYISEFFDFDFEIRAVLNDNSFNDRENILKKFMKFSYDLHNKGIYHIDYSPGNILVKYVDNDYLFSIIDVNRMKFIKFDDALRMQSIAKLTNKQNDNNLLVELYAKISNKDKAQLLVKLNYYIDKQQQYLNNKKRLKKMRKKNGK